MYNKQVKFLKSEAYYIHKKTSKNMNSKANQPS